MELDDFGQSDPEKRTFELKCQDCGFATTEVKKAMAHVGKYDVGQHTIKGSGPFGADVTIEMVSDCDHE